MAEKPLEEPAETKPEAPVDATPLDEDPKIDNLVDEIQHSNSDAELAAAFVPETPGTKRSLKQKYLDNKKWTIPLTVVIVLLIIIFGVPTTRYKALGLVLKKTYTITVNDATTGTPVSKATVKLGAASVQTDASGKAVFKKLSVGSKQAFVSKQYYKTTTTQAFVGLKGAHDQKLLVQATGRQVAVKVINKITGEPVTGAEIKALGTSAKTDKAGSAVLVLPADHKTALATITGAGYNNLAGTVQVTTTVVPGNTFAVVPAGRAYFLSNASGKVDVISANYDGSDRQTLLAGTGVDAETDPSTQLIVSPDQKYLALIAHRSGASNALGLYNIVTATGKMTQVESDQIQNITPVGWSDGVFVYFIQNNTAQSWQPIQQALRSYNGGNGTVNNLDQTDASGSSYNDALYQQFSQSIDIVDGSVLYAKSWFAGYTTTSQLASKTNTIYSISPNGSGKKSLKDLAIPANTNGVSVGQELAGPQTEYFASPTTDNFSYAAGALFFKYTKGNLTQPTNFTADDYANPDLKGYLATSPSGNKLLYSDTVDGKTVASVSDQSGDKQKIVTLHGVAQVIGWLTDDYILVSQDNSQLYVISASPAATKAQPLSLASFYTSPQYR
jgi:hypothetical protein